MCLIIMPFTLSHQLQGVAMKTLVRLLIIAVFSVSLLALSGCGKEVVSPYVPTDASTGAPEATDIE